MESSPGVDFWFGTWEMTRWMQGVCVPLRNNQSFMSVKIHSSLSIQDPPADTKIHGHSSPWHKMVWYLHVISAQLPGFLKSCLGYLQYLIRCNCYIHSCFVTLWFLGNDKKKLCTCLIQMQFFFPEYFFPQLVESTHMEDQLYIFCCQNAFTIAYSFFILTKRKTE